MEFVLAGRNFFFVEGSAGIPARDMDGNHFFVKGFSDPNHSKRKEFLVGPEEISGCCNKLKMMPQDGVALLI